MTELEPRLRHAAEALEGGDRAGALAGLMQLFAEIDQPASAAGTHLFMTMFLWEQLAERDAGARTALAAARDEQVRRILAGDPVFGNTAIPATGFPRPRSRYAIVVEMNKALDDPASTHALFVALERMGPVDGIASASLPALVAVGDFVRAERYRRDPLEMLEAVNLNARTMPLFPEGRKAPRLAAELMGLTHDAAIGIAVLRGLGRPAEAEVLRAAVLDGLESDALRAFAKRELEEAGTISRELVAHQMAWEATGVSGTT